MKRWALLSVLVLALVLVGSREEPTAIHKWDAMSSTGESYQFVISNPPDDQKALIALVRHYLKETPPPGFWEGKYAATFYRESRVTPIDGNRPEASWWDQSWDVPYIEYKPIDEEEIVAARYLEKSKKLRIFFPRAYWCENDAANDGVFIDVKPDGSHGPICDANSPPWSADELDYGD